MYKYKASSDPTSQREKLVLTRMTCLIGLVAGVMNLLVFSGSINIPGLSMPPELSPWFWFSIPVTCIVWIIFRFSLPQRDLSIMLILIVSAAVWIYWLSTKPEPVFIGYVLIRARGLVDVIAFDSFLIGVMATTDLIMLKPWTPFLVIAPVIIMYMIPRDGSRAEAGLAALVFITLNSIVGCMILETIYLLFQEFSAKPVAD
jgi:hypothetical protein